MRVASLGLGAVVICLAAFSIVAASLTQDQVAQARHHQDVRDLYVDARAQFAGRELSELEYILGPTAERRADLDNANGVLVHQFETIARGDPPDAALAEVMLALHAQYLVILERETAAAAAGDQAEALAIEVDEADPIVDSIKARLEVAAAERQDEALAAFGVLATTTSTVQVIAPLVFAIGFVLLFVLWRMLDRDRRATLGRYRVIEQLGKLRAEFVATVSHEFRTPLTGIQGFSEIMRDEELTVAEMREYAGDINKDARRLSRLINNMLDLDRMESGQVVLHREPLDMNRIVTDAAAKMRLGAARHPIDLQLDPYLPPLAGDADRLTQVVTNLLGNAIKYSPSGGAIEVRTTHDVDAIFLTIRDHGMGIPPDQLETIFTRYTRVEATRAIEGTGLGLPIVRQIVALHGGSVSATSEPGQGSVFHVRLPISDVAPVARAA